MKSISIIGGGLSGLIIGNYLIKNGYKVTIYEMKKNVGGHLLPFNQKRIENINIYNCFAKEKLLDLCSELNIENISFEKIKYIKSVKVLNDQMNISVGRDNIKNFFMQVSSEKNDSQNMRLLLDDLDFIYMRRGKNEEIGIKKIIQNINLYKIIKKYKRVEVDKFLDTLKDKKLKEIIKSFVNKKSSMMYFIDILVDLFNNEFIKLEGGNKIIINALVDKFISQGGIIELNSKIEKIKMKNENKKILLVNGKLIETDIVVSSINAFYSLIYLLEEKNINKNIDKLFLNAELFDSYVIINLIVKKELKCKSISNRIILDKPFIDVSGAFHKSFDIFIANDNQKTVISVYVRGNYDYWKKKFEEEFSNYELNKVLISRKVISELQKNIKDIENLIEDVEIITPYEYCIENNVWRGVDRGWIPTPKFYGEKIKMKKIKDIYFCGNLFTVGSTIMGDIGNAREIAKNICLKDNIKFN